MAGSEKQKNTIMQKAFPFLKLLGKSKDLGVVVFIVCILFVIIMPLPSYALDLLLTISIALSMLIILIALYINKPMDFSTFPTLLLFVTAYRLALNVATTRMILSEGSNGAGHVSKIVEAFGQFVAGGNYVIGIIIFTILVIVNLLVITNGSTRVTEVRARFALDAMPGKQMAIDADMNAGLIDEKEAKTRREQLSQEADFYGAMDGASKFVKGDAIAAIIITIVNIAGGFAIGVFQGGMDMVSAAQTFTILTIGDGIVGQIPALIVATATGIVATRTTKGEEENFANSLVRQLTDRSKTLVIVGFILFIFALAPSFPWAPLLLVASLFWLAAWLINRDNSDSIFSQVSKLFGGLGKKGEQKAKPKERIPIQEKVPRQPPKTQEEIKREEELRIADALKVDILKLELGYELICLADVNRGGDLLERIRGVRSDLARSYGFVMPQVRVTDDTSIKPNSYKFSIRGVPVGGFEVFPDKFLAMDHGLVVKEIEGIPVKEPVGGKDALWIEASLREDAAIAGYISYDASTVISSHVAELVKRYAEELITKDEVKKIIDKLEADYPALAEEIRKIPSNVVRTVLQSLLREGIPINDMLTIMETITDVAPLVQNDVYTIIEHVRSKLARVITNMLMCSDGTVKFMTFSDPSRDFLKSKLKDHGGVRVLLLNTNEMQKLVDCVSEESNKLRQRNLEVVPLVVDSEIRASLSAKLMEYNVDHVVVISYVELDSHAKYEHMGLIHLDMN